MRGGGQRIGYGNGLQPITELESENHQSMVQYNMNQFNNQSQQYQQQNNNNGYRNTPQINNSNNYMNGNNMIQNNYQQYNNYQQQGLGLTQVREENLKYQDLEKIFSDTDDSASRLNDSILDDCDNLVPKDNQRQFSQNVLNQFQNYRQSTTKEFLKHNHQYQNPYQTDKSLDLTLNLTKNYNSNHNNNNNNMILGGLNENSVNESLANIVHELGGDSNLRQQGSLKGNQNLNDTQVMYQKYEDTVKMMSQLQRQLGSSVDSNQASMFKSDKFRTSYDNPQFNSNNNNNNNNFNSNNNNNINSNVNSINSNINNNYISGQYGQQQQIQQSTSSPSHNLNNNNINSQQNYNGQYLQTPNSKTNESPLNKQINTPISPNSNRNIYEINKSNNNPSDIKGINYQDQQMQKQIRGNSSDIIRGNISGLQQSNVNPNLSKSNVNSNALTTNSLYQQQHLIQSPSTQNMINSNAFSQYSTPQAKTTTSSQFLTPTSQQSPFSMQSSHYSAFQGQGLNQRQRRIFNQEQKLMLKQAEQRMQSSQQVDPFLYQKRMEQQILGDRNYQKLVEEELPVFCINCEEYIKLPNVDKHAENECDIIQKRKLDQKNNPYILQNNKFNLQGQQNGDAQMKDISDKIQQIEIQISQRLQKLKNNVQTPQISQLIQSTELVLRGSQSIRINNDNAVQIQQTLNTINQQRQFISNQNENSNIGMIILWDRLVFLAEEKALKVRYYKETQSGQINYQYQNNNNNGGAISDKEFMQMESELRMMEGMTQKERENVQFWKMKAEMMEQIKKQDINNIKYMKDSHQYQLVKNLQSERDSETQSSAGYSSNTSDLAVVNKLQVINPITQNAEDRKKIFFSEALSVKFKLQPNHPGKQADMQQLYELAQKLNVPQSKWSEFIHNKIYSMV